MTTKKTMIHYIVVILVFICTVVYLHYDARSVAENVVRRREHENLTMWREKLLPVYDSIGLKHDPDPKTYWDLFSPLLESLETMQTNGNRGR